MHQNILNYGYTTYYCPTTINSTSIKNPYLKTIIDYIEPDVFTVNEIKSDNSVADNLLDNVMNTSGRDYYARVYKTGSGLSNMVYYDTRKLVYESQTTINTTTRITDLYRFYYNSPDLESQDTAYIYFIVTHLEPGNGTAEAAERANMTSTIMDYLDNNNLVGNYLFCGDLNLYTSSEDAYTNLLYADNQNVRFYDPINTSGNWNNSSSYRNVHTQSTHADDNDCAASGGMDDRFDFILISNNIKNNLAKVAYIEDTYIAVGQDGNHFNNSINDGENSAVPSEVADALYNASDHLPIYLELEIDQTPVAGVNELHESINSIDLRLREIGDNFINFDVYSSKPNSIYTEIYSLLGENIYSGNHKIQNGLNQNTINTGNIKSGIYFIKVSDGNQVQVKKFLKK
jgi:endonuclease/exonuclease/phosphatase family metal-dependent hydrolase